MVFFNPYQLVRLATGQASHCVPYQAAQGARKGIKEEHHNYGQQYKKRYKDKRQHDRTLENRIREKSGTKVPEWKKQKKDKTNLISKMQKIKYGANIKVATLNCRGINRKTQREQIIEIMKKKTSAF